MRLSFLMNIAVGAAIFIIYGTFIVLYFIFNRKKDGRAYGVAYINSIVCYGLCLAAFALLPQTGGERSENFIPFINFLKNGEEGRTFEFAHFLGYALKAALNILLFMPLGIFTAVYCKLNYVRRPVLCAFLLSLAVSIGIEFLQWLLSLNRAIDIDHVIYNVLGAVTGVFIFKLIQYKAFVRRYLKMLRLSGDVDQILS